MARRRRTQGRSIEAKKKAGIAATNRAEEARSGQRGASQANIDRLRGISRAPTTTKTTTKGAPLVGDVGIQGTGAFGTGPTRPTRQPGEGDRTFVDGEQVSQEEFDKALEEQRKPPEATPESEALGQAIRDLEELEGLGDPISELSGEAVTGLAEQLPGLSQEQFDRIGEAQQEKVREFLKEQNRLDDLEKLENIQSDAVRRGSEEDQIQIAQELLRKKQKDRAVSDQTEAEVVAQRALFREQEQATLLGQELDRSEGALKRQQDAITRGLDTQTREFEAAQGQLDRQGNLIGREQDTLTRGFDARTREFEAAQGQFGRQGGALDREQGAIGRGLASEERQFGEATAEIGRQRDLLGRTEAGIRRQGSLAARAGQVQQAAAANIAAQSGFASSSALQGSASSAGSIAATSSGDILTGLVATGAERGRIAGSEGLLNAAFEDARASAADAQAGVADRRATLASQRDLSAGAFGDAAAGFASDKAGLSDRLAALASQGDLLTGAFGDIQDQVGSARADITDEFGRLRSERFKLGTHSEDIAFEQQRLRDQLSGNLDFLQDTFRLGGDIGGASAALAGQRDSKAERDRQRQSLLSGIGTGAAVGSSFGPVGAAVGAGIGGVIALFG